VKGELIFSFYGEVVYRKRNKKIEKYLLKKKKVYQLLCDMEMSHMENTPYGKREGWLWRLFFSLTSWTRPGG